RHRKYYPGKSQLSLIPGPARRRARCASRPRIDRVALDHPGFVAPFERVSVPLARHVRTQIGALHLEIVADVQLRILELDLVRRGLDIRAVQRKARLAFPGPLRRGLERHAEGAAVSRRIALPRPGVASRQIAVRAGSAQHKQQHPNRKSSHRCIVSKRISPRIAPGYARVKAVLSFWPAFRSSDQIRPQPPRSAAATIMPS